MKDWQSILCASGRQKKLGQLYLNKKDFKPKSRTRDKKGRYIMIKESIHQVDKTVVNTKPCNIRAPKYFKEILMGLKGKKDNTSVPHFQQWIDHPNRKSTRKYWT